MQTGDHNKHLLDETESNNDNVILGEAKLSPILFCTDAINWMLDEVKSNKCFIIPKKSVRINKVFGRGLCLPK